MTEPNPKAISKTVLDGCFRWFQSGQSPVDLVADLGIDPAIAKYCYELFLADPHAHGDGPIENRQLIVVRVRGSTGAKSDGGCDPNLS